jgi:cold shock CspA family protein
MSPAGTEASDRLSGKVQWFSRLHGRGRLATIAGRSLDFSWADAISPARYLTEGQVVTYTELRDGSAKARAGEVRAAHLRERERHRPGRRFGALEPHGHFAAGRRAAVAKRRTYGRVA